MATDDRDAGGTAVVEPEVLDVVGSSALEALVRGEIDVQIATAKRYPRSLELFTKRAIAMATLDEETAESCIYRRPVGKKKNDKTGRWEEEYAEGMSVRMSEIVGACYGNLRVYAQLVEETPGRVRARGMAIDLETNFASSSEVLESTLKQDGSPYSARMRIVVAKACLAKARRDATFQVVPKALAKPVETAVRKVLLGDAQTIDKRRQAAVSWIGKLGIEIGRVWAALGIQGPADLGPDQLFHLTGLRTAIKDNETTIDEAFPPIGEDQRDHLEEELAAVGGEAAEKLRTLFAAKKQSKGQALAFLRQYKGKVADLIAVLEAIPTPASTTTNGHTEKAAVDAKAPEAGRVVTSAPARGTLPSVPNGGDSGQPAPPNGPRLVPPTRGKSKFSI